MTDSLLAGITEQDPANFLEEMVGPGKKYATVDDLAKGSYHAQKHIPIVEKQLEDLRTDYKTLSEKAQARANMEDLVKMLGERNASSELPPVKVETEKPTIDLNVIDERLIQKLREYEVTKKQTENFNIVRDRLIERFGNSYQGVIKDQIESLGLTEEDVNNLARKSPDAFFNTLGLNASSKEETFQAPPKSNSSFRPMTPKKRTMSYYREMRKTNPNAYHDRNIAIQMERDAQEQGEAFFDVN